jgi:hypothetical protein
VFAFASLDGGAPGYYLGEMGMRRFSEMTTVLAGFLALIACSSSSSSGITDGGYADATPIPEGGSPLANGTCSFGFEGTTIVLAGYASMNGSGNLKIQCASAMISLSLGIGDPTYDGPGEYAFSPDKIDGGNLELVTTDARYDATMPGTVQTGCIVDVTVAPANDNNPPVGSAIAGSFHCTALPRRAKIADGQFDNQPSGSADVTAGTFSLAIR